jgi:hypothetical protein
MAMSVIVVPAAPPRAGLVLPELVETSPLSAAEAADLYAAMLGDVCVAAERSGGDLLVNYLPDDELPEEYVGEKSAEAAVRGTVNAALEDPDVARFETQVGSDHSARVGNSVTHLLSEEDVNTVQVVEPTAPTAGRTVIDSTAMKLRRRDVVLGPAARGRVYLAAFGEPIDFADAYTPPAVETLTDRGLDAGLDVDFVESAPLVETGTDMRSLVSLLRARQAADRNVPPGTMAVLDDLGAVVVDGELRTDSS